MSTRERIAFGAGLGAGFLDMALVGSLPFAAVVALGVGATLTMAIVSVRDLRRRRRLHGNGYLAEQMVILLAIAGVGVAAAWSHNMAIYAGGLAGVLMLVVAFKKRRERH